MPKTEPSLHFDSVQQEAYLALWRTYDRLRSLEDELFERFELTPQQYNVLRLLRSCHPTPVPTSSLVDRLVSRAPDVTRMVDRLEQRLFIVRSRTSEDRRAVLLGITAAGLALLSEMSQPLRLCHKRQLGHLSSSELKMLVQLMRKARGPHETADSPWK